MISITRTPVLILSTPRTGSTVLCAYVKSLCTKNVSVFIEPDYKKQIKEFESFSKQTNDFIVKLHAFNLHLYDTTVTDFLLQEAFKIRIRRRDFVKQVASWYIADKQQKFHYFTTEKRTPYSIPIDIPHLTNSIKYIIRANAFLDNMSCKFDLDLFYEDLPVMDNCVFDKTPPPLNHAEILSVTAAMCGALNKN